MELVSTPTVDADYDGVNDTYPVGGVVRARVTFDGPVDVVGNPVLELQFDPTFGNKAMTFNASGGRTNVTTLEFTYTVVAGNTSNPGIAFFANKLSARAGATIRAAGTETDADLSFAKVDHDPGHRVDTVGPRFVSAIVYGAKVRFTFDERIDPSSANNNAVYNVEASDGFYIAPQNRQMTIGASSVVLSLREAVPTNSWVKVNWSLHPVRDAAGNESERFGLLNQRDATNKSSDPPPTNSDPEFDDGTAKTFTIAENSAAGAWVGTVPAGDVNGDTLTWSLTGADASNFVIGASTGRITLATGVHAQSRSQVELHADCPGERRQERERRCGTPPSTTPSPSPSP